MSEDIESRLKELYGDYTSSFDEKSQRKKEHKKKNRSRKNKET
ncbi:MAG TPA: hypothetical protein VLC72_02995 [Nitrosopumilaceae archaeon]|nr:hypothetical protein [Nitrosopumilaceae archaeon]